MSDPATPAECGMPVTDIDIALTATIMDYWIGFARGGEPNTPSAPRWPTYAAPDFLTQELGDSVRTIARPESALCRSFDRFHATAHRPEARDD